LPRQTAPLPVTTVAECDTYDGYFYITPGNYTWQLQCTTNYVGDIISQSDAASYSACIDACVQYNADIAPRACLGINFNAASRTAVGLCTQYSDVQELLLASEDGGKRAPRSQYQALSVNIAPFEERGCHFLIEETLERDAKKAGLTGQKMYRTLRC
jgi:hypothetical protein